MIESIPVMNDEVSDEMIIQEFKDLGLVAPISRKFGRSETFIRKRIPFDIFSQYKKVYLKHQLSECVKKMRSLSRLQLENLFKEHKTWQNVGNFLGVSPSLIINHRKELGMFVKYSSHLSGRDNPRALSGKRFLKSGYVLVWDGDKRICEHNFNMEKFLGRKLIKGEGVHHIDLNKSNNSLANLVVFSNFREHQNIHYSMEKLIANLVKEGKVRFNRESKEYEEISKE